MERVYLDYNASTPDRAASRRGDARFPGRALWKPIQRPLGRRWGQGRGRAGARAGGAAVGLLPRGDRVHQRGQRSEQPRDQGSILCAAVRGPPDHHHPRGASGGPPALPVPGDAGRSGHGAAGGSDRCGGPGRRAPGDHRSDDPDQRDARQQRGGNDPADRGDRPAGASARHLLSHGRGAVGGEDPHRCGRDGSRSPVSGRAQAVQARKGWARCTSGAASRSNR